MLRTMARAGITSRIVGQNCTRLRGQYGVSLRELSELLDAVGVSITAQSLNALERGTTAVTVDLLTALAVVLGVTPTALLMPFTHDAIEPDVELTGVALDYPMNVFGWLSGEHPLDADPDATKWNPALIKDFRNRSRPVWAQKS
jgi:transcriptional regulator with XRE-family HTH domain